jgi:hypothetical protein
MYDPNPSLVNGIAGVHTAVRGAWNFTSPHDANCEGMMQHCMHGAHQAFLVNIARGYPASGGDPSTTFAIMQDAYLEGVGANCKPTAGSSWCE